MTDSYLHNPIADTHALPQLTTERDTAGSLTDVERQTSSNSNKSNGYKSQTIISNSKIQKKQSLLSKAKYSYRKCKHCLKRTDCDLGFSAVVQAILFVIFIWTLCLLPYMLVLCIAASNVNQSEVKPFWNKYNNYSYNYNYNYSFLITSYNELETSIDSDSNNNNNNNATTDLVAPCIVTNYITRSEINNFDKVINLYHDWFVGLSVLLGCIIMALLSIYVLLSRSINNKICFNLATMMVMFLIPAFVITEIITIPYFIQLLLDCQKMSHDMNKLANQCYQFQIETWNDTFSNFDQIIEQAQDVSHILSSEGVLTFTLGSVINVPFIFLACMGTIASCQYCS